VNLVQTGASVGTNRMNRVELTPPPLDILRDKSATQFAAAAVPFADFLPSSIAHLL